MSLSDAQFGQYQRDGYVVVEDCLDGDTVEAVTERMLEPDAAADAIEGADPVRKFEGLGMIREDDVFAGLVTDGSIVDVVQQLQGPNNSLLRSAAMLKPPRVGSEKQFHQDAAYYPIHPMDPGDVLFQHCLLPHYTAENGTDADPPAWVDSEHISGDTVPGCV